MGTVVFGCLKNTGATLKTRNASFHKDLFHVWSSQCCLFKVTQHTSGIAVIIHCFFHLLGKEGKILHLILICPRMTGRITGLLLLVPMDFTPSEQGSAVSSPLVGLILEGIGFIISLLTPKCPVLMIFGESLH